MTSNCVKEATSQEQLGSINGPWPSRRMIADRALGSLLGQAIGDALGFRYQYRSGEDVRKQIAMDRDNTGFLPVRGSTVFDFPPGQVSDNSELCMVLARSLCRIGNVSTHDFIRHLFRWANSNPLNMDETMINALNCKGHSHPSTIKGTSGEKEIEQRILSNAFRRNVCNLSNKCLFLAVPLAIASVHSNGASAASCRVGRLMQPNPIAIDALRVLIITIRSLILKSDVELAYDYAYNTSRTHRIREHILHARVRPHPQTLDDDECCSSSDEELRIDYLGIALQCAIYQLTHATGFTEGVVAALQIGGDTIANAAITASLLGARYGSNNIPKQWKDTVTKAQLHRHCSLPDIYFGDITNVVDKLLTKVSLHCS